LRLGSGWIGHKKRMKKINRVFFLPGGSRKQTCKHAMTIRALGGTCAKTNFSKNHQFSQGSFGMIVGRLNVRIIEEYKKYYLNK
jgi:hypothetical protein